MTMKKISITVRVPRKGDKHEQVSIERWIPQFDALEEAIASSVECGVDALQIINKHLHMLHANYHRVNF